MVSNPDKYIIHKVHRYKRCWYSLENVPAVIKDIRQVFDLLSKTLIGVTEHQAEEKVCTNCGEHNKADFDETGTNIRGDRHWIHTAGSAIFFKVHLLIFQTSPNYSQYWNVVIAHLQYISIAYFSNR